MSRIVSPQRKKNSSNPAQGQLPTNIDSFESYLESAYLYLKTFEEIKIKHLTCCKRGCKKKVKFECKCLAQTTFMCRTHIADHLEDNVSKNHLSTVLNSEISNQKWDKVVNYLKNYNIDLKNLKKMMVSKVTEHVLKINKDVACLFTNINAVISKNTQKILDLSSSNLKTLENMIQLQSNSMQEFTKKCDKIEISRECLVIMQAELSSWNVTMMNQDIAQIPEIAQKSSRELLHWCQWKSNKVHYFDWNENTHKSVKINGLDILRFSRSISIDHNNILLCGGVPDDNIPRTNGNTSKVYKINLDSQSFQILASMNTGRGDHCMTYLNGFYYVLGGRDNQSNRIKKCERYSLENDRWEDIANLARDRDSANCVSISKENWIYVIGGTTQKMFLFDKLDETIEKYDTVLNNWTLIQIQKPILSQYLGCCLLPDSNFIFIFGGSEINDKCQKECYLYDYKTNKVTIANPISSEYNQVFNIPMIFNNKVYCYFVKSYSERELSIYNIEPGVW